MQLTEENRTDAWELVTLVFVTYQNTPPERQPSGLGSMRLGEKWVIRRWVKNEVERRVGENGFKSIIGMILIGLAINLVVHYATKLIIKWIDNRKRHVAGFSLDMPKEFGVESV